MSKLRILAVENDPEWLAMILRLFPEHVVKPIRDYADALLIVEDEDMGYDVAIVDLNLIDPPGGRPLDHGSRDMLGGDLLVTLYEYHPSVLRIALSGRPLGGPSLEILVAQYHVDEFFRKDDLDLADLRRVVRNSPAARAAARERAVPGVEVQVAEQRERLQAWAEVRQAQLSQQMEGLQEELRDVGRLKVSDTEAAAQEAALRTRMEHMADRLAAIPGDFAKIEGMLDTARGVADVGQAAREIDRLMGMPGAAAAS